VLHVLNLAWWRVVISRRPGLIITRCIPQYTLQVFLAICCQHRYHIGQVDIDTAFLNGSLKELVYMRPPPGIRVPDGMVYRLLRSRYGLKQAAAVWYDTIAGVFEKAMGFRRCVSDACMFIKRGKTGTIIVVLYVDDMLIGAASVQEIDGVKQQLGGHLNIKDLGAARLSLVWISSMINDSAACSSASPSWCSVSQRNSTSSRLATHMYPSWLVKISRSHTVRTTL
jgi:hypothetical protein